MKGTKKEALFKDLISAYSDLMDYNSAIKDLTSNTYNIVSSSADFETGNYVIDAYDDGSDYAMGNVLSNKKIAGVEITFADEESLIIENPAPNIVWKITKDNNTVTFYNAAINKYLNIIKDGSYGQLALEDAAKTYSYATIDQGPGNSDTWKFTSTTISNQQIEGYNGNFQAYNSQTADIYLYKQDVTPNGYITNKTNRVTLHYDANAGEEVIADVPQDARINKGEVFTLPTDELTRTGYTHLGWNENSKATEAQATITPAEDVTVYAVWQVNSYTLTWELNGGTVKTPGTEAGAVNFGAELTAPVLEKTGYTYTWSPVVPATMPASNSTYSAIWTANEYEITYKDENDADFSGSTAGLPTTHIYGTATTLVNPTKEHFTFNGWYINSDCSGELLTSLAADGYTDNITLYAKWTEDSKVTVTFSDAIHDNNSDYMEYVGDQIQFPTITDAAKGDGCEGEHYHFVGWTKDASQPNALVTPASETAPATDITYYAVWAKEDE